MHNMATLCIRLQSLWLSYKIQKIGLRLRVAQICLMGLRSGDVLAILKC
jgi:hypothetical protein